MFCLTPELFTGIPAIDEQHGELFDIANEVVRAADGSLHPHLFHLALDFLVGYTIYHFAAEELVMDKLAYPERARHAVIHGGLRDEVLAMLSRVREQGPSRQSRADVVRLFEDWVVSHVREADRDLARFVREQPMDLSTLTVPTVASLKRCGAIADGFDERFAEGGAGLRSAWAG